MQLNEKNCDFTIRMHVLKLRIFKIFQNKFYTLLITFTHTSSITIMNHHTMPTCSNLFVNVNIHNLLYLSVLIH